MILKAQYMKFVPLRREGVFSGWPTPSRSLRALQLIAPQREAPSTTVSRVAWATFCRAIMERWQGPPANHMAPALTVAVSAGDHSTNDLGGNKVSSLAHLPVPANPSLLCAQPGLWLSVWSFWTSQTLPLYILGWQYWIGRQRSGYY